MALGVISSRLPIGVATMYRVGGIMFIITKFSIPCIEELVNSRLIYMEKVVEILWLRYVIFMPAEELAE